LYHERNELVNVQCVDLTPFLVEAPRKDRRYSSDAFDVSIKKRSEICPAGKRSTNCSRLQNGAMGDPFLDVTRFSLERGIAAQSRIGIKIRPPGSNPKFDASFGG
jgi:hypothetical protein